LRRRKASAAAPVSIDELQRQVEALRQQLAKMPAKMPVVGRRPLPEVVRDMAPRVTTHTRELRGHATTLKKLGTELPKVGAFQRKLAARMDEASKELAAIQKRVAALDRLQQQAEVIRKQVEAVEDQAARALSTAREAPGQIAIVEKRLNEYANRLVIAERDLGEVDTRIARAVEERNVPIAAQLERQQGAIENLAQTLDRDLADGKARTESTREELRDLRSELVSLAQQFGMVRDWQQGSDHGQDELKKQLDALRAEMEQVFERQEQVLSRMNGAITGNAEKIERLEDASRKQRDDFERHRPQVDNRLGSLEKEVSDDIHESFRNRTSALAKEFEEKLRTRFNSAVVRIDLLMRHYQIALFIGLAVTMIGAMLAFYVIA
jgi:chromosome segregation ATPase